MQDKTLPSLSSCNQGTAFRSDSDSTLLGKHDTMLSIILESLQRRSDPYLTPPPPPPPPNPFCKEASRLALALEFVEVDNHEIILTLSRMRIGSHSGNRGQSNGRLSSRLSKLCSLVDLLYRISAHINKNQTDDCA
jgi:hypothetical protein